MDFKAFLVIAAALSACAIASGEEKNATDCLSMTVTLSGHESPVGQLAVALFDSEDSFDRRENAVGKAWLDPSDNKVVWQIEGLLPGSYALLAYHDANGNNELDLGFMGIPKEKVGISGRARGLFGPPSWGAAKFLVEACQAEITIELS